jgi:hypothetical protein
LTTPSDPTSAAGAPRACPAAARLTAAAASLCLALAATSALGAAPAPAASAPPAGIPAASGPAKPAAATSVPHAGTVAPGSHTTARSSAAPSSGGAGWVLPSGGPHWTELTASQHQVLAPLAGEWNGLDATGKEKWLEVAKRFPHMSPEDQGRVRDRMVEWVRMTPQQRSQARLVFQENRDVSREQRQALWQQYQALPEDKKRELAQREIARRSTPASAAATGASSVAAHKGTPLDPVEPKSNVVHKSNPSATAPRPVAPVVVQARPGATTTLVNKTPVPPAHQTEGGPKIAVGEADVDRTTLLPRRGPQHATAAASSTAGVAHPHAPVAPSRPVVAPVSPGSAAPPSPAPAASHP